MADRAVPSPQLATKFAVTTCRAITMPYPASYRTPGLTIAIVRPITRARDGSIRLTTLSWPPT